MLMGALPLLGRVRSAVLFNPSSPALSSQVCATSMALQMLPYHPKIPSKLTVMHGPS